MSILSLSLSCQDIEVFRVVFSSNSIIGRFKALNLGAADEVGWQGP